MKKYYFNHAGIGQLSAKNHQEIIRFIDDQYEIGAPEVILKHREYIPKLYSEVAKLLNCNPDDITYIKNTTEGIIIASESLPLKAGDEVLIMDNEYSANYIPWLKKRKEGVVLKFIEGSNNEERYKNLLLSISNRTKVITVSWVHFFDGYMINLKELSVICKKKHIFLVVDGIQGIGTRVLDLKDIEIDFLCCGGHKHLGAIMGSGFMYVNNKIINKLNDYKIGTRSVKSFSQNGYNLKSNGERFEDGTPNLIGIVSLYHAVNEINKIGIKKVEQKNKLLLSRIKELLKIRGVNFIDYKDQGNVVSIASSNTDEVINVLSKENIYLKNIKNNIRVSFNYKSGISEIKHMINRLGIVNRF